jgi:two-component system, OmpR family, sensor histidine kinase CiaH
MPEPAAGMPHRTESRLLRRTRRRLIAWSAGSTLAFLVVLGIAIYAVAATSLATTATDQLQDRLMLLRGAAANVPPGIGTRFNVLTDDPGAPGVVFGGATSGTLAVIGTPFVDGKELVGGLSVGEPGTTFGLDAAALARVRNGETVIVELTLESTPVRVLAASIATPVGPLTAYILGDRTAEVRTLGTLLLVLVVGGLAVLAGSIGVGSVYAGRALVPIRESLRRQREFAADASHELRTPLAITRAAIAELRRSPNDPATVSRSLEDLDAGTDRLHRLVDDLLLLARTDAEAVEIQAVDTDLAQVAAETVEGLESVARDRGVRLRLDIEPSPLQGDPARLGQLVSILVDNAIRHSPAEGLVTIAVRKGRLVVEDDGRGIAAEHLPRVFERFWRAPGMPPGGTGLGLAIAAWIVERHGGTIAAGNRPTGQGARFLVTLPAA